MKTMISVKTRLGTELFQFPNEKDAKGFIRDLKRRDPKVKVIVQTMKVSTLIIRVPTQLHKDLKRRAKNDKLSLNKLCAFLLRDGV